MFIIYSILILSGIALSIILIKAFDNFSYVIKSFVLDISLTKRANFFLNEFQVITYPICRVIIFFFSLLVIVCNFVQFFWINN